MAILHCYNTHFFPICHGNQATLGLVDLSFKMEINISFGKGNWQWVQKKQYILGPNIANLGINEGHARAKMGQHVTKLPSLNTFHTKNISKKFHQNLINQIEDI